VALAECQPPSSIAAKWIYLMEIGRRFPIRRARRMASSCFASAITRPAGTPYMGCARSCRSDATTRSRRAIRFCRLAAVFTMHGSGARGVPMMRVMERAGPAGSPD
jgi:hypothetical protein